MDDDGALGIRNWGYYEQPIRNNIGLQLMPGLATERDVKNLPSNGAFLHRNCGIADATVPMDYARGDWAQQHQRDKMLQAFAFGHHNYATFADSQTVPIPHPPDPPKDERPLQIDETTFRKGKPLKRRAQDHTCKAPKTKKPKKEPAPKAPRGRSGRKYTELVINGIDLDISGIPIPVCTCTGTPQPCYRWGMGGWQSACCTNNMSTYPLPMSTKRRGARIAGRKMSQGAFKKVLEKLAGEGYNLSNPIDLKGYWAKHGTNKFVTIR